MVSYPWGIRGTLKIHGIGEHIQKSLISLREEY
jgi:hypothetical protein